jgi:hypothetical protein
MSYRIVSAVGTFAVLAAGCAAKVEYVAMVPAPRQLYSHSPDQVETLLVTPAARPHVDIGMLRVRWMGYHDETREQMMDLLRAAAGQHGCDALVITRVDLHISQHSPASIEGSCEVYRDIPPTTGPPPSAAPRPPQGS